MDRWLEEYVDMVMEQQVVRNGIFKRWFRK
jgi:hypothetical protein